MHLYKNTKKVHKEDALSKSLFRPLLIEKFFFKLLKKNLIWLAAPAGYGKSILMQQIFKKSQELGFYAQWISAEESLKTKLFDFHFIKSQKSLIFIDHFSFKNSHFLSSIFHSIDENKKYIIASRELPHASVFQQISSRVLGVFQSSDLQWTFSETLTFLKNFMKIPIQESDCHALYEKVSGWPVAIRFFGIEAKRQKKIPIKNLIKDFSGACHNLQNYFSEIVMPQLKIEEQELLKRCSVFKKINQDLVKSIFPESLQSIHSLFLRGFFLERDGSDKACFLLNSLFQQYLHSQLSLLQWKKIVLDAESYLKTLQNGCEWVIDYYREFQKVEGPLLGLDEELVGSQLREKSQENFRSEEILELTKREKELVEALKSDNSLDQIAKKMYISKNTLKTHLKKIYKKLKIKNRSGLLLK